MKRRALSIYPPALAAVLALLSAAGILSGSGLTGCAGQAPPVVVGSKNFTEQIILGEMISVLLERRGGMRVDRRLDLNGTFICFNALKAGKIDLYVEYTGTALTAILEAPPTQDRAAAYRTVSERFAREFDLDWTEPLGFRNDFAIIVRPEDAKAASLRTLSDLARESPRMRAGFGPEFLSREDGYPGLARTYGMRFRENPLQMDLGLLYRALEEKKVDVIVGNSTDGLIDALHLVVLEDDRGYFPAYEAAPVVRHAAFEAHPGLRETLASVGGVLSEATMRRLNYAVDGEKKDPRSVATDFLRERKLIP